MKKQNIGQTKHMTAAKATRQVLESYQKGKLFTLQDDLSLTGLMYDVSGLLGYWPEKAAVKKAMERLGKVGIVNVICINTIKSIYQVK